MIRRQVRLITRQETMSLFICYYQSPRGPTTSLNPDCACCIKYQNYLLEELATGQKKVIHHELMRYIPEALAQKIADKNNLSVTAMEKTALPQVQGEQDSDEEQHDLMTLRNAFRLNARW